MASYHRQSSPIRAEYFELSSPDPLGNSSSVQEISRMPTTRRTSAQSSARRQSNDIDVEIPLSPSKMVTQHNLSPWRIKVTVEAEPETSSSEFRQDETRAKTTIRTMKVPLRDESPSSGSTKSGAAGRRVRKSVSPARGKNTRSRRQSVTDLNIVVLGDDAEEDEWTAKPKSPRKRSNSKSQGAKKTSASRKSGSGAFEIRADEEDASCDHAQDMPVSSVEDGSPELKEIDVNQVVSKRRAEGAKGDSNIPFGQSVSDVRKVSINSAISYPTPSPTASEHGGSDADEHAAGQDDGCDAGMDTMMESEGFTMIDLNSLPSVKHMRESPGYPTLPQVSEEEHDESGDVSKVTDTSAPEPPSIAVTTEETHMSSDLPSSPPESAAGSSKKKYSIAHLQLPSSTNVQRHRLITPMPKDNNPYSSPRLPSPPRAPASTGKDRSPIHSDSAMEAGSMLQGALEPALEQSSAHEHVNTRSNDDDVLFEGFSSSTRRELRAELRFGEELAKKQFLREQEQSQPSIQQQVWRGETTVQHTPPAAASAREQLAGHSPQVQHAEIADQQAVHSTERPWLQRIRKEREDVIERAQENNAVIIESDQDDEDSELDDGETTMGDIWLAEAKQHSSSPKEVVQQQKPTEAEKPRRTLIPSPWKRGEQIEASRVSNEESFSGLFWKQQSSEASDDRFGGALIANPDLVAQPVAFDRRRSGIFDAESMTPRQTRRLSPRQDEGIADIGDSPTHAGKAFKWRSAEDVIEEETTELEAEGKLSDPDFEDNNQDAGVTHLYETNLDAVQDISSSPQVQSKNQSHVDLEHDSTYSSLSEASTIELYRQRTSLSPSKERPNTPRSALKGGRASFGAALTFDASDDVAARRVVWAKKSKCVNEEWEESTRSIKSCQESTLEDTPVPSERMSQQGLEASFEVQPQPPAQQQNKAGWFAWFAKKDDVEDKAQSTAKELESSTQRIMPQSFDDSSELSSSQSIEDESSMTQFHPTSRTTVSEVPEKLMTPSYLLPPSYPSDRNRDANVPLATSGSFTNTHFRTLHIIYRKSFKSRFHGPAFPHEIRPSVMELVQQNWKLEVDESATMGEDGMFEFTIGGMEARVLERFMREVEQGYAECENGVEWGWTASELAEKLGRIAIGEKVREEEKAVDNILRSARKVR